MIEWAYCLAAGVFWHTEGARTLLALKKVTLKKE
jgi:hypothetical protein